MKPSSWPGREGISQRGKYENSEFPYPLIFNLIFQDDFHPILPHHAMNDPWDMTNEKNTSKIQFFFILQQNVYIHGDVRHKGQNSSWKRCKWIFEVWCPNHVWKIKIKNRRMRWEFKFEEKKTSPVKLTADVAWASTSPSLKIEQ